MTIAFGLGIDLPLIRRVIHIGVPRTMEEYFQEIGRDGPPAVATIYFNRYDIRSGDKSVDPVMRDLVTGKGCKRELILNYFGHILVHPNNTIINTCCDNDAAKCKCTACTGNTLSLQLEKAAVQEAIVPDDCPKYIKQLSISKTQKFQIRNALEQHMESLYFGPSCVGGMSLATGFTKTLIDKTLEHCEHLVSVDAVEHFLPVYSRENAMVILDIVKRFSTDIASNIK